MTTPRRTQAERRAETRAAVLESACRLFGSKGFADTSLEEIAAACGLTIRPIYHYFGNKLELFATVNELMEERIVAAMQNPQLASGESRTRSVWRAFLALCREAEFRRIVLIDAPTVLGRERWTESSVTRTAADLLQGEARNPSELATRMLLAALAEAALSIAESDDPARLSREAEPLVESLLDALGRGGRTCGH